MDRIKCFFECLVPVTACNLKCDYCYVIQEQRNTGKINPFKYTPKQIGEIFSYKNVGGTAFFSLCGAGETLFHPDIPYLVECLINAGHYINITSNGTYTKGIEQLLKSIPGGKDDRVLISFSLHYLELLRKNMLQTFVDNVHKVQSHGCSILIQINLYDGYLPYLEEIKNFCIQQFGALPQVAATRDEGGKQIKLHTNLSAEEYKRIGDEFNSPLFRMTMDNFNNYHNEYCHAGLWSYVLDLGKGTMKSCYCNGPKFDMLSFVEKRKHICPVGYKCGNTYCINSSHFLSLGVIPNIYQNITYASLRNRITINGDEWFQPAMKHLLSQKLQDNNKILSPGMKSMYYFKSFALRIKRKMRKILQK